MLLLWKLWDLLLQIVVKIFVVILYKIYYYDKIQMWYFTYWVLSIIIKFLCMLAGRSAVDIWWWLFEGEVFSVWSLPWWQWHLNGSRLRFLFFSPVALRPNAGQCLLILEISRSHTTTHHSRQDSSGRVISSSQRPLPDNTQHSQQTNIHAPVRFELTISAGERPQIYALGFFHQWNKIKISTQN